MANGALGLGVSIFASTAPAQHVAHQHQLFSHPHGGIVDGGGGAKSRTRILLACAPLRAMAKAREAGGESKEEEEFEGEMRA